MNDLTFKRKTLRETLDVSTIIIEPIFSLNQFHASLANSIKGSGVEPRGG